MRLQYPDFKVSRSKEGTLVFTGTLQPKIYMPVYTIAVEYRGEHPPKVRVIDPPLVERPPHYYHVQGCLCLYKPENFNWTATKPIGNHIIPWTSCWIYFYEVWRETKVWLGPEADHADNAEKQM